MTEVRVTKKFINVIPIQNLIQKTDSLVDDICFIVNNYVDGVDFQGWSWHLYYKSSLDDGYLAQLTSEYVIDKQQVRIYWKPNFEVTANAGNLTIQLRGRKDTDDGLLKWNTSVATIRISRSLMASSDNVSEDILEDYLDRFEQLAQSGIVDIQKTTRLLIEETTRSVQKDASLQDQIDDLAAAIAIVPHGEKGDPGRAATVEIGEVREGDTFEVQNVGTPTDAVFDFTLVRGNKGDPGTSITDVSIQYSIGDASRPYGNWVNILPQREVSQCLWVRMQFTFSNNTQMTSAAYPVTGDRGSHATIAVNNVNSLEPWEPAYVRNVGTEDELLLDFGIPRGYYNDFVIGTVTKVKASEPARVWLNWEKKDGKYVKYTINFELPCLDGEEIEGLVEHVEQMRDEVAENLVESRQILQTVTGAKEDVERNTQLSFEYMENAQQAYRDTQELAEYLEKYTIKAFKARIGNGGKTYTINHALNTQDIIIQCWSLRSSETPAYVATKIDNDILQLDFESDIATNSIDVVISAIDRSQIDVVPIENVTNLDFMSPTEALEFLNGTKE